MHMHKQRPATIQFRLPQKVYERVGREAHYHGISLAQFARGATFARAVFSARERDAPWADEAEWLEAFDAMDDIIERDRADQRRLR
jgi:hypothetical protein